MQNPAVNLLKLKIQEEPKNKKVKIHFLLWGIILAFFVLVGVFFDKSGWRYGRDFVSQVAVACFLPADTQIFVWCDLNNNFFGFDEKIIAFLRTGEKFAKIAKILPEDLLRDLRSRSKELALAQLPSAEEASQILIFRVADQKEMANFLRAQVSGAALNFNNAVIYRAAAAGGEKFYYLQNDDYFFFSSSEQSLAAIVNLKSQPRQGLESNLRFQQAKSHLGPSSSLVAYFNLGDNYPMSLRLDKINSQGLGLEVYYDYQEGNIDKTFIDQTDHLDSSNRTVKANLKFSLLKGKNALAASYKSRFQNRFSLIFKGLVFSNPEAREDSYLKFLPPSPFLVLRTKAATAQYNQIFTAVFWRFFDPDGSLQKSLADFGEEGSRFFGGAPDLELIGSLKSDGEPAATLILGGTEEDLQKVIAFLQNLAAMQASREEETILPDSTQITEYIMAAEIKPEEVIIDGINIKIIPLTSGSSLFYGYLDGKLVLSNGEETLREIIASFHASETRDLAQAFSEGQEWFYFDLEKMGNFGQANFWPGLKKLQGSSRKAGNGTLFTIWLEI